MSKFLIYSMFGGTQLQSYINTAIYEYPIAYFKSLSIYLELSDEEINKLKTFFKENHNSLTWELSVRECL